MIVVLMLGRVWVERGWSMHCAVVETVTVDRAIGRIGRPRFGDRWRRESEVRASA